MKNKYTAFFILLLLLIYIFALINLYIFGLFVEIYNKELGNKQEKKAEENYKISNL